MILYFSSTGNCRHVAQCLAKSENDRAVSITDISEVHLAAGESLGMVFPTYYWRLPSVVDDFFEQLTLTSEDRAPYIYFIATYGSTCGGTGTYIRRHLRKLGYSLTVAYSIRTVDDWTVLFDVNDAALVEERLAEEARSISEITGRIAARTRGDHMKSRLPMIAVMGSGLFYNKARRTVHLHAENSCIGCGKCAAECPTGAIELQERAPVWVKDKCAMCLHCLHSCPTFAIQYDDSTRNHGQYMHP